jgi:monofunctional biosynthetic peptidoglycan transglycosylase
MVDVGPKGGNPKRAAPLTVAGASPNLAPSMKRWWFLASLGALVAGGAGFLWLGLPSRSEVRSLAAKNPETTALMRQREAEARARKRKARVDRTWVPLERVSRHLIQAVVASEDQKFFGHEGVDWKAVQESLEKNVEKGRALRGGSTITQQLAKNLYFGTEKTLARKVRELVVTRWMEADLTKRRILTLYLNVIEWGDGVYGAEAASRRYFGKPASDLTVEEAAALAAAIPSPRRLNPERDPARNARAAERVLWLMASAGYIARDVSGLGSEPPPEVVVDEEAELPPIEAPAAPSAPPADPSSIPTEAPPVEPASPSPPPVSLDTSPPPVEE